MPTLKRTVEVALSTLDVPIDAARTLVGVAGTVTTMAAMVLDLEADRDAVDQEPLAAAVVCLYEHADRVRAGLA